MDKELKIIIDESVKIQKKLKISMDVNLDKNILHSMKKMPQIPINSMYRELKQIENNSTPTATKNVSNLKIDVHQLLKTVNVISSIVYLYKIVQMADLKDSLTENNSICKEQIQFINIEDIEMPPNSVTKDEVDEVNSDIGLIMEDTVNWQQKLCGVLIKWKTKNPVIACFISIIFMLFMDLTGSCIYSAMTKKDSTIKELPQSTSLVINNIETNQTVNITNEAPYYFEVEFVNEETNEKVTGWISKRNVKVVEHSEEEITVK